MNCVIHDLWVSAIAPPRFRQQISVIFEVKDNLNVKNETCSASDAYSGSTSQNNLLTTQLQSRHKGSEIRLPSLGSASLPWSTPQANFALNNGAPVKS